MIKFENTEVIGWEHAIRGMRNPMNSWDKSDTCFSDIYCGICPNCIPGSCHCDMTKHGGGHRIGPNDHKLMMSLAKNGPVHAKYRRMIVVYVDITVPLYWWKEFDTYRVGVTPNPTDIEMNSCSTMHKIHEKEFALDDFSHERLLLPLQDLRPIVDLLNQYRDAYLVSKEKCYWWQMIQLLPSSYNQRRTVMLNYEVLAGIYRWRKDHKLDEWSVGFIDWIKSLPYSEIITGEE